MDTPCEMTGVLSMAIGAFLIADEVRPLDLGRNHNGVGDGCAG